MQSVGAWMNQKKKINDLILIFPWTYFVNSTFIVFENTFSNWYFISHWPSAWWCRMRKPTWKRALWCRTQSRHKPVAEVLILCDGYIKWIVAAILLDEQHKLVWTIFFHKLAFDKCKLFHLLGNMDRKGMWEGCWKEMLKSDKEQLISKMHWCASALAAVMCENHVWFGTFLNTVKYENCCALCNIFVNV